MKWQHALLLAPLLLGACAMQQPERRLQASDKGAVEMRAMQSRLMDGDAPIVTRGVIATLQDLGYRINKAEPSAGTITATKLERLRLTTVVRPVTDTRSVVRANAFVLMPGVETQVDDPEFYRANFFAPLSAMLGREAFAAPAEVSVPEAVRTPVPSDLPSGNAPRQEATR